MVYCGSLPMLQQINNNNFCTLIIAKANAKRKVQKARTERTRTAKKRGGKSKELKVNRISE